MQVFSALKRAFAAKESKEKKPENSPKSNFGFLIQQPSLYRAQLANWGRSTEGNLGRDTRRTNTELPEYVTIEARVLNVSARGWHTVVVTDIGCFGFGWNEHGNLGLGHTLKTVSQPTLIPNTECMIQCATGEGHTLLLRNDYQLFGCGWTSNDQITSLLPLEMNHAHVIKLDYSIPADQSIHKIVCGYRHSAFLTSKGVVYIADKKRNTARGFIKAEQDAFIIDIDATMHSTIMLSRFGHVSILGDQKLPSGIIALQEKNAIHFKAISMGRAHILLLTDKNTVWGFGKDFIADDQCIQLVNGVAELRSELFNGYPVQISAGRNFSLILTNTNKLYSFGVNSYHQLGRKTDALVDQVDFSNAKIPLGMKIIQIQAGCDSATVIISQLGNVEQFVNNLHHQLLRRTEFSDLDLLVYE